MVIQLGVTVQHNSSKKAVLVNQSIKGTLIKQS